MANPPYLLALEGGGTRSQAALLDISGKILHVSQAGDVNTNFTTYQQAQAAVLQAVRAALEAVGIAGADVMWLISALVGPKFGAETFAGLLPNAQYRYHTEGEVVFARGGIFQPHGVAVVAATGATCFVVRADSQQRGWFGGWGSLLGDEGSAYAMGLLGLRCAARALEGRVEEPTNLIAAVCSHFGLRQEDFRHELVHLAYQKPLSRADIAGFAVAVSQLAAAGDAPAAAIQRKVASDLAALALHAARQFFTAEETFDIVAAGGLLSAGEPVIGPLRDRLQAQFPHLRLHLGTEMPAVALGKLALYDLQHLHRP